MAYQDDHITSIPAPLPKDYDRGFSFTDFQTLNPGDPMPGASLDNEFANIEQALDETQARARLIQRDDGALANNSVGPDQLIADVLAPSDVVDNLQSTAAQRPLSANQGRVLDNKIGLLAPSTDPEAKNKVTALSDITSLSSLNTAALTDKQQFSVQDGDKIRLFAWNESADDFDELPVVTDTDNVAGAGTAITRDTGTEMDQVPLNTNIVYPLSDITALGALNTAALVDRQSFYASEYVPASGNGGGQLEWDSSVAKSAHDGIKFFSPTVPVPSNWSSPSERRNYRSGVGESDPSGSGCFVRPQSIVFDSRQAGEDVVQVYVSATGSDSDPGSEQKPFTTLQRAFDYLKSLGSVLRGEWQIEVEAGTYNGQSAFLSGVIFPDYRLIIYGPDVSGGVPTAVFDGTGAASPYAIDIFDAYVKIQDLKVQNYTNIPDSDGVRGREDADLWCVNVHADNCDFSGIAGVTNCRLRVYGGIVENCNQFGVRAFGSTGFQIGTSGQGVVSRNNGQANVLCQDGAQGTIIDLDSDGSQSGVNLRNQASARITNSTIDGATVAGVLSERQSRWNNDNNTFGAETPNSVNWLNDSYSTEVLFTAGSRGLLNLQSDNLSINHSGSTSLDLLFTSKTIPANHFIDPSKKLIVKVWFSASGAGTKSLGVRLDGENLGAPSNIQAGLVDGGVLEVEVSPTGAGSQNRMYRLFSESQLTTVYASLSIDMSISRQVRVYGQLSDASGTLNIHRVELDFFGG